MTMYDDQDGYCPRSDAARALVASVSQIIRQAAVMPPPSVARTLDEEFRLFTVRTAVANLLRHLDDARASGTDVTAALREVCEADVGALLVSRVNADLNDLASKEVAWPSNDDDHDKSDDARPPGDAPHAPRLSRAARDLVDEVQERVDWFLALPCDARIGPNYPRDKMIGLAVSLLTYVASTGLDRDRVKALFEITADGDVARWIGRWEEPVEPNDDDDGDHGIG